MASNVIVTGGCGYIGSHVARAFQKNKNSVYTIDRVRREHTLKGLTNHLIADYSLDNCLQAIKEVQPDVIVHCAGTSLVGPSVKDPAEYYDNNVSKTIKLLNAIKDMEKKPVVLFSSSASVYGDPDVSPLNEDDDINPISPYGNTKLMIERILEDYANAYGINSICFRYFNAAGAEPINFDLGQEPGATHIVARALESSINGTPFILNGNDYPTEDGTCIRDYIHVWDLAEAHVKAAKYATLNPGSHIFNLGTNRGTSNKNIIDYVANKWGFEEVNIGDRREGDPAELVADAAKANKLLGWIPKYSDLSTIIESSYKWYSSIQQR